MRTIALIVAAGRGERAGGGIPKQFRPCAGRPLAWHAVDAFCRSGEISEVVIALPEPADLDRHLQGADAWPLPVRAVAGGEERQDSVASALDACPDEGLVLVHDAARPLVSARLIREVRRAAAVTGAAVPALPCEDTLKRVAGGRVRETVDRSGLMRVQTPQGFRLDLLREAHRRAAGEPGAATDDAALVERLGAAVAVVPGDPANIKVTRPEDLALAERLLAGAPGPGREVG